MAIECKIIDWHSGYTLCALSSKTLQFNFFFASNFSTCLIVCVCVCVHIVKIYCDISWHFITHTQCTITTQWWSTIDNSKQLLLSFEYKRHAFFWVYELTELRKEVFFVAQEKSFWWMRELNIYTTAEKVYMSSDSFIWQPKRANNLEIPIEALLLAS